VKKNRGAQKSDDKQMFVFHKVNLAIKTNTIMVARNYTGMVR